LLHALWYWPEVVDDSYITFRYARNLVAGAGLAFNPGDPQVEGFSSPSWLLLSALGIRLGVRDPLLFAKLLGLVLHVGLVPVVWGLAGDAADRRRWPALLAPLAYATFPFAAYHAVGGMETPLAAACLATAGVALLGLRGRPRAAGFGLWGALAALTLTRPEAFGYALALLAAGAWVHRREAVARRALALAAAGWLLAWAALLAWRWITFGALEPNTALAKAAGPQGGDVWWRGVVYVARFFRYQYLPADTLAALAAAVILARARRTRDAVLAVPLLCACGFSVAVRGDWMHGFRFLVPAIPFVCALLARAALAVEDGLRASGSPARRLGAAAVAAVLALFLLQNAMIGLVRADADAFGRTWKPAAWPLALPRRLAAGFDARLAGVTRWTIEHMEGGGRLATGDIGFPAWASDAGIVDLVGLTDAGFARLVPRHDVPGYATRLRERRPEFILLRTHDGKPDAAYDRLTVESGVLAGYLPRDSVETYGRGSLAVVWARPGAPVASPGSVLARYDRAIRWSPRVPALARWRAEFLAAHPEAAIAR
jgi:hypothetical protein